MTSENGSLTDADRRSIRVLVTASLGSLPAGTPLPDAIGAWRRLGAAVQAPFGWAGIYELAHHCAIIATEPVGTSLGEFKPTGILNGANRVIITAFVNAAVAADHTTARNVFTAIQPDQEPGARATPDTFSMVFSLLNIAWKRLNGKPLDLIVAAGTRWPPMCDFCCAGTGVGMYRCRPFTLPTSAATQVVFEEDDVWYACALCRTDLEHPGGPDWEPMMTRLVNRNPGDVIRAAERNGVRTSWTMFQERRLSPTAEPLPATRPHAPDLDRSLIPGPGPDAPRGGT